MSILKVDRLEKHSYRLIAVPSQKLDKSAYDYSEIESDGVKYKIIDHFKVSKSEVFPTGMMLLATGKEVLSDVWAKMPKSKFIILFIVEEML